MCHLCENIARNSLLIVATQLSAGLSPDTISKNILDKLKAGKKSALNHQKTNDNLIKVYNHLINELEGLDLKDMLHSLTEESL